mmetsp:Transcript_11239/g.52201  ORF Transcript_11239/g.52201 Transcript_11239/m.52201 type:complete len:90 (-) Transcript_11239:5175-5444(-)
MRISVTLGMSAAANWQKSATDSSMGTASTQTIGDLPSGNEAGAFVVVVVVVVAPLLAVRRLGTHRPPVLPLEPGEETLLLGAEQVPREG